MSTAQQVQSKLNEAYTAMKSDIHIEPELSKRLSAPLCMQVTDKWINSQKRVLVVGQETNGWEFEKDNIYGYNWPFNDIHNWSDFISLDESVEAMTHAYEMFDFSKYQPVNHRAPFFRAYRQIREAVGNDPEDMQTSVLWTNMFKMSISCGSVVRYGTQDEIFAVREASRDVLYNEINALQPTSIIFFTGPLYDNTLISLFPGVEFSSAFELDQRKSATLSHTNLPKMTWRTYHPAYLQRSKKWDIVDSVCEALKK